MDVIKTRLQVRHSSFSTSSTTSSTSTSMERPSRLSFGAHSHLQNFQQFSLQIWNMVKSEGFTVLFKGVLPRVFWIAPGSAITIFACNHSNYLISSSSSSSLSFNLSDFIIFIIIIIQFIWFHHLHHSIYLISSTSKWKIISHTQHTTHSFIIFFFFVKFRCLPLKSFCKSLFEFLIFTFFIIFFVKKR